MMAIDKLPTIGGDAGPLEATPVVPFDPSGNYAGPLRLQPRGYEQYAVGTDNVVRVIAPQGTAQALIKPEGADIRYRDDGVDPTLTLGMPIAVGESLLYDVTMGDMRIIGQAPGAICNVAFYGEP